MFSTLVRLRREHTTLLICTAVSCLCLKSAAAESNALEFSGDMRRWQDRSGAHTVEAELVEYQNRRVTLRDHDGNSIVIPLDQLSESDQQHVVARIRTARSKVRQNAIRAEEEEAPPAENKLVPLLNDAVFERARANETQLVNRLRLVGPREPRSLCGVQWRPMRDALTLAAEQRKPVLWFRVLGDVAGFM